MRYTVVTAATLGLASCAFGATSNSLSINQGGFTFALDGINTAAARTGSTGNGSGGITYFGPAGGDVSTDSLMTAHGWWYRSTGDTREYGLTNQTSFVQNSPSSATVVYSEPSANGTVANALQFTFTYSLIDVGADTAKMLVEWTVTNTSNVSQDLVLFNYTRLQPGGLLAAQSTWNYQSLPNRSQFQVWQGSSSSVDSFMTYGTNGAPADQNDRWGTAVTGGASVPTFPSSRLTDSSVHNAPNLNSLSISRTPNQGGFGGALQWNETLAAGASLSGTTYIGYQTIPAPASGVLALIGACALGRRRR